MKKLRMLGMVSILTMAVTACGNTTESPVEETGSRVVENVSTSMETMSESIPEVDEIITETKGYASAILEKESDYDDLAGQVLDVRNEAGSIYVATQNKVYCDDIGGLEQIIESEKDISSFVLVGHNIIILQHADNTREVYCSLYDETSASMQYKKVTGMFCENVVYAMVSGNSNSVITIEYEEEQYFVNRYHIDKEANLTTEELNIPLSLDVEGFNNTTDNIIQILHLPKDDRLLILTQDGKLYGTSFGVSIGFQDGKAILYPNATSSGELLDEVEKVYDEGDDKYYSRPLFEMQGNTNSLYTYNDDVSWSVKGTPEEKDRIAITLPDGYSSKDIKNVVLDEIMLVEFVDGAIYNTTEADLSKLIFCEELTKLNNEKSIVKIELLGRRIGILMDDMCIYTIEFDN